MWKGKISGGPALEEEPQEIEGSPVFFRDKALQVIQTHVVSSKHRYIKATLNGISRVWG